MDGSAMEEQGTYLVVDTNVWLDFYAIDREKNQSVKKLLTYAFANGIGILYPACIIKDVYYIVAESTKASFRAAKGTLTESDAAAANEFAWSAVNHMRENAFAVSVGQADIWLAAKYRHLHNDFEDNLVIAVTERTKGATLITNDAKLIQDASVPTMTPEKAYLALSSHHSSSK